MAVPAYLRQESKAKFVTVAVRLAAWTLKWCKDERLFTRRERWIITGDIWEQAKRVLLNVKMANARDPTKPHDCAVRESYLLQALDALVALKMLLTIKYEMILRGFNATKATPENAPAPSNTDTDSAEQASTDGQPSRKKTRRGSRKRLTQDDIDRIFEIFFELAIEEQGLIRGVIRSDAERRAAELRPV